MHEHLTTTDEPFISIKCCFVCGTVIRNAVVINTFTLCILLRTCIPVRGQLNHKQEICNPFWSTVSCKLFTTLQYCLVLSESLMATQFYVVEFPSEEEKCRGPYLVPAKLKRKTEPLKFCGVLLTNLWVALWRYTMKQHASSKVRSRNVVISKEKQRARGN